MRGEKNCRNLAAALGIVDRYMTRRMGKQVLYTNIEIEALLNKYPDIRRSLQVCAETKKLVSKRLLVGCHYLFAKKDELAADQFVEKLISGSGIVEGEPVYMLRERILHNSLSKAKLTYVPLMAMIIKAWNYQRSGTNPRKLKWVERGPTAEAFPVVE